MSILLKDGYTVTREPMMDERRKVARAERSVAVVHPAGGSYIYRRAPAVAPLDYLTVPPEARGQGRAKALLDHFAEHLDHRGLHSQLEVAPMEAGITPQGLRKLYQSRGWRVLG